MAGREWIYQSIRRTDRRAENFTGACGGAGRSRTGEEGDLRDAVTFPGRVDIAERPLIVEAKCRTGNST